MNRRQRHTLTEFGSLLIALAVAALTLAIIWWGMGQR